MVEPDHIKEHKNGFLVTCSLFCVMKSATVPLQLSIYCMCNGLVLEEQMIGTFLDASVSRSPAVPKSFLLGPPFIDNNFKIPTPPIHIRLLLANSLCQESRV